MICRAIALFALLSAAITPTPPQPDSWLPFADQRVVSPSGQRYVVIRADGRGITYELRRRAPGRPAMTAAKKPFQGDDAVIAADPADRLIVKGKFGQKPLETIVPDGLDGFLMFEKYANVGGGQSVTWIDAAGKAAPDLKLAGIFPVTPAAATRSVSSLWWYQGCFLDEAAKSIVVVAVGDELREVAIADGAVTEPGVERLVAWCKAGTAAGRALALEVASRGAPALRQAGAAVAVQIFHDANEPLSLRLRAAVLLAQAGSPVACEQLFDDACAASQDVEVRRYAVANLGTVLGNQAMPRLRDLMRGEAGPVWSAAQAAFASLGEAAIPTLCEMLGERDQSGDYRGGAAFVLGSLRKRQALPALLAAIEDESEYVALAACNAAIDIDAESIAPQLISILQRGSTQDGRIALYLEEYPTRDALAAIDAALQRLRGETGVMEETVRVWLEKARTKCAAAARR